MATLILSAVGTAVGGPIGGALGALAGQRIDAELFSPKARHGPRLGELAVQTSSYGTAIPKLFGTMRVAGTVIWSTDLKEQRTKNGGGKGRPKSVGYSYSASFAVALSGRPVRAVRRIWADGKLLRGAAGDFKSETGFRFYPGSEGQDVDPLIASIEGAGQAPAHRGLAYAVFEDFQLADYSNRIPSLTFELEADAGPVGIGAIAEELAGEIAAGTTPSLDGYAASGDSVRGAIEALGDILPLSLLDEGGRLLLTAGQGTAATIGTDEEGARGKARSGGRTEIQRRAAGAVAGEVTLAYYEVERDYQAGLQRAFRGPAIRSDRRALPAVLRAGAAKSFAEHRLSHLWAARETAKLYLAWRRSGIRPGTHLRIEGRSGLWKVARWTLDRMVIALELVRVPAALAPAQDANPGRAVGEADQLHGATTLFLFDAPLMDDGLGDRPRMLVAAAGVEPGWRRASLMASYDGGASWEPEEPTAAPAVMGRAVTPLGAAGAALFDRASSVEIELLNQEMWLEGRSDAAIVGGGNLALLGNELIQFGVAEPLGNGRFRLSRLLRGRLGSEWAGSAHAAGERFVLLERESLVAIDPPPGALGGRLTIAAQGIGDGDAAVVESAVVEGRTLKPPTPVHFTGTRTPDGDILFQWVRRSRSGWLWLSGSDTPLAEEQESYRLLLSGTGFERVFEVGQASCVYTAAQQAEDGFTGSLRAEVMQIGTHASSVPAQLDLS